ncbi:hypothetical protein [Pseudemcibacter aquimaris]|uniref:hypothetical protein n=1 Tax=Pseudemcibacter aquimaris TaxID=2857064 RepID=UPI0020113B50|nr:hypothetical protein [Pseudemcibacter aquimaris]MCC3862047.1 hypothetical protein [Pseudemcibacter aquimaris]WDU58799.1 hypothetical protein KW060_00740 [Pseudemcibacter aquimaris]
MSNIEKLTLYIEENLRATVNSGMDFVDPKNFKKKLLSKQNHVVFGRRGAGKSSLVSSINDQKKYAFIYINLEDYKDISFPNIILYVLKTLIEQLIKVSREERPLYKCNFKASIFRRHLNQVLKDINLEIQKPDFQETDLKERNLSENGGAGEISGKHASASLTGKKLREKETSTSVSYYKIENLKLTINKYQKVCNDYSKANDGQFIFLILDDFYFLKRNTQAYFVDFFHRISKGTSLYLKVATIKHRSTLYVQEDDSYIGTELGHDIYDIDLDYTLDKFDDLQVFMKFLLEHSIEKSGALGLKINEIFAGDSFKQLCLASGGVPRDFLSLFVKLIQSKPEGEKINKIQVTDEAISSIRKKMEGIGKDSEEDANLLEKYLQEIKTFVYHDNRTNVFLVSKEDLENIREFRQALKELVDLRLIHIIHINTSCAPSDGKRYEAYMIDVGLYDNSRPMNFTYVEPGAADDKGRKDRMRASPKLKLDRFLKLS